MLGKCYTTEAFSPPHMSSFYQGWQYWPLSFSPRLFFLGDGLRNIGEEHSP